MLRAPLVTLLVLPAVSPLAVLVPGLAGLDHATTAGSGSSACGGAVRLGPPPGPSVREFGAAATFVTDGPGGAAVAVVASPGEGRVYPFVTTPGGPRRGAPWPTDLAMGPGTTAAHDALGASLAGSGEWLAIGAPRAAADDRQGHFGAATGTPHAGVVYLVRRACGAWRLAAVLRAPRAVPGACFGAAVALARDPRDGDVLRVLVGAPGEPGEFGQPGEPGGAPGGGASPRVGAAYAFRVEVRPGSAASVRAPARLTVPAGSGAGIGAGVGASVAIVGAHLVVAAPGDGRDAPGAGAVHVFDARGRLVATRRAGPTVHGGQAAGARYGERIAALGDARLAVASPPRGAVEVLEWLDVRGGGGGLLAPRAVLRGAPDEGFGLGLAGTARRVLVGAPFGAATGTASGAARPGRVAAFREVHGRWVPGTGLAPGVTSTSPSRGAPDQLGHVVALHDASTTWLVTAPGMDETGSAGRVDAGAAFLFRQ